VRWLRKFASNSDINSYSTRARAKKIEIFLSFISGLKTDHVTIADIGGTSLFWNLLNKGKNNNLDIILVNLDANVIQNFKSICGRAENLKFIKDKSFEVCFSNSVIEHIPKFEDQQNMANDVLRIAKYYFIQTPAFIFPVEQHFLFPFFHWLPKFIRIKLVQKYNLGWFNKQKEYPEAEKLVDSISILTKRKLRKLFPDCNIITERFIFIPKSYIVTNFN
jgi:hypothetical protein